MANNNSSKELNALFGKTKDITSAIAKNIGSQGTKVAKAGSKVIPMAKLGGGLGAIANASSSIGNLRQGRTARGILDALQALGYTSALVAPNPVTGGLALLAGASDLAEMGYDKLKKRNGQQTSKKEAEKTPSKVQEQIPSASSLPPIEDIDIAVNTPNQSVPPLPKAPQNIGRTDNMTAPIMNMVNTNGLNAGNGNLEYVDPEANNIQTEASMPSAQSNPEALRQAFDDMLARYQASNQQRQGIYQPQLDYLQKYIDEYNKASEWQARQSAIASGLAGFANNPYIYKAVLENDPRRQMAGLAEILGKQAQLKDELRFDPNQVISNAEFASSMGYNPMMALASKDILNAIATAGRLEQQQRYQQSLIDLKNREAKERAKRQNIEDEHWDKEYNLKVKKLISDINKKDEPKMSDITSIRKEFNALPAIKNYNEIKRQYNNVKAVLDKYSQVKGPIRYNAKDQTLITTFNKVIDPSSVVRESEFDRTAQGQSIKDKVQGALDKISKGGSGLSEAERDEVFNAIETMYQSNFDEANSLVKDYADLARRFNINPADIMPHYYREPNINDITQKLYNAGYSPEQINQYLIQKGLK